MYSNINSHGWERASKSKPCEICGKPDNCNRLLKSDGTLLVWCGRSDNGTKLNGGGQRLHIITGFGSPLCRNYRHTRLASSTTDSAATLSPKPQAKPQDWAKAFAQLDPTS